MIQKRKKKSRQQWISLSLNIFIRYNYERNEEIDRMGKE